MAKNKRKLSSSGWRRLIIISLLLLAAAACLITELRLSSSLLSQQAAARWQGQSESAFAQVSCFLAPDEGLTLDGIYEFRSKLQSKFTEASLTAPEHGSLYCDAWSSTDTLSISGERGQATASVIAVGGDFFLFHPLTLLNGSYISEADLMQDRVVLDRELAWKLFGSYQLEGETVLINKQPFIIAGVVEREQDKLSQRAYGNFTTEAGLFMSFEALLKLNEEATISCYELVAPEPVHGFSLQLLTENFPCGSGELRDNSTRFSFSGLLQVLADYGQRSMRSNGAVYPYWENAARSTEDWCALLLLLIFLLLLYPVIFALQWLIRRLLRWKNRLSTELPQQKDRLVENYYRRRELKRANKAAQKKQPGQPEQ